MSKTEKIAVFGSAFNPPTLGHLSVIKRLNHFDRILLVPNYRHAWGKTMAPFDKRCAWLASFVAESGLTKAEICKEEQHIGQKSAVTTWALLNHLQALYPQSELTFVLGPDNLLNFGKFDNATDILANWSVLACPEAVNIRSTMIRERLAKQQSIESLTTPQLSATLKAQDFI